MAKHLEIGLIRMDGGTQPRAILNFDTIDDYAHAMKGGAKFPPVDVFYDGSVYWLADGFHRVRAANAADAAELVKCEVVIHQGTVEDAKWFSYGVNKTHGLPRTNDDKQRAVKAALAHPNAADLSDAQIAEHCGVSHTTVANYRPALKDLKLTKRTGRDGKTYDVSNIGRRKQPAEAAPAPSIPAIVPEMASESPDPETVASARAILEACRSILDCPVTTGDLAHYLSNRKDDLLIIQSTERFLRNVSVQAEVWRHEARI